MVPRFLKNIYEKGARWCKAEGGVLADGLHVEQAPRQGQPVLPEAGRSAASGCEVRRVSTP